MRIRIRMTMRMVMVMVTVMVMRRRRRETGMGMVDQVIANAKAQIGCHGPCLLMHSGGSISSVSKALCQSKSTGGCRDLQP